MEPFPGTSGSLQFAGGEVYHALKTILGNSTTIDLSEEYHALQATR